MARVKLYLGKTDEDSVFDAQGAIVPIYHKRLTALVWVGSSFQPYDGLVDTGSPLTIIPELVWRNLQSEIEWLTAPPARRLKDWCTSVTGVTGGAIPCKLGRIQLTAFDLGHNQLTPFPVLAKFAQDNGSLRYRLILGLWGGTLENRRLVIDNQAAEVWLAE